MVGYLGAQAAYEKPARLYYALSPKYEGALQPYYYKADIVQVSQGKTLAGFEGLQKVTVDFEHIRP